MPIEVCCPGEFGRTMRTQLGLRQDGYVALMTTHLGRRSVLLSELKGTIHGGNEEQAAT